MGPQSTSHSNDDRQSKAKFWYQAIFYAASTFGLASILVDAFTNLGSNAEILRFAAAIRNSVLHAILPQNSYEHMQTPDLKNFSVIIVASTILFIISIVGGTITIVLLEIEVRERRYYSEYRDRINYYANFIMSSRKNIILACTLFVLTIAFILGTILVYYQTIMLRLSGPYGDLISISGSMGFFIFMMPISIYLRVTILCVRRAVLKDRK